MKKLFLLFISVSLFSFTASTEKIDLLIPEIMKSKEKLDLNEKDSYEITTQYVVTKDFKGEVKVIMDNEGKVFKITVPENFPKRLYPSNLLIELNNSVVAFPCSDCANWPWGTQWLCYLSCEGSPIDPDPKPGPVIEFEN